MRVLITGGAGFIGANLVEYISKNAPQIEIVVLDDLSSGKLENLDGLNVQLVIGSVLDAELVQKHVQECDAIVHLAALGSVPRSISAPRQSHDVNVNGTLNVLEAARNSQVKNVIFASSSSVYGANPIMPKDELSWTRPMSPYAATKLAGEAYMSSYATSFEVPTLSFRFFNVFGPKQSSDHVYAAVIPRFIKAILKDEPVQLYGDGIQSRDFTYVGDVCAVIWDALSNNKTSSMPINLAAGTSTSLIELISILSELCAKVPSVEHYDPRKGDVQYSSASSQILNEVFPDTRFTSLREGLQSTINWNRLTIQANDL